MTQQSKKGVIAWMASNSVAANLLMLIVMIGGLSSISKLPKEVFPSFPSERIIITVPYPGSSPEEVEAGIVRTLEEELQDLMNLKEISSVSREGSGSVTLQMNAGTSMADALVEVKNRVDSISSFPANAEKPVVSEELTRFPAMNMTLSGDIDERELKEFSEDLRDEILRIPGISQISIRGVRDYEISIEISDTQMQRYGLGFDDVAEAIRQQSRDLPGGKLRTDGGSFVLRSVGQAYDATQFSNLNLIARTDGTILRLGDIAQIRDGFEEQAVLSRFNGKPSLTLEVERVGDQDVLAITESLREFVEAKQAELPAGIELTAWRDWSQILSGRISLMLESAAQGALLVAITLTLFLRPSLAFWVILGLPFSFLGALWVIDLFGLTTINTLSVLGFILVLGMLVDDGIVTAESAYAQLEEEGRGIDSIVGGVRRVAVATVFGALTTMIAFAPAAFLTEGIGRLFSSIVPPVVLCLLFSLLETKLILPAHLRHMRQRLPAARAPGPLAWLQRLQQFCSNGLVTVSRRVYGPLLEYAVNYRYIALALFLSGLVILVALIPAGILRFVFFPNLPSNSITVELSMPSGTPWQTTHSYSLRLEQAARAMDQRYREQTGRDDSVIRELLTLSSTDTEATVSVELVPSTQRDITSMELASWMREAAGELSGAQAVVFNANAGPFRAAIDMELSGKDLNELRAAARELKLALLEYDGVSDVRDTFNSGGSEFDIQVTPEGEVLGLTRVELARQVRQAFFGAEAQKVQRGRHEVRVYVRLPIEVRQSLDALRLLWIDVPGHGKVPFDVVGTATERTGVSVISRIDRRRVVNLLADVDKSRQDPAAVIEDVVQQTLPDILARHPGIEYRPAGEAEAQQESTSSLKLGFSLILLLIYAALAIPLRSYFQPLIIMTVIPFGLTGALLGHLIVGSDVSIISIIGMIGVTGIVVNDSLVLVDHINHRLRDRADAFSDAVINGAVRRFRPVVLTSLTTFVGLVPIQLETAIQAQFVKPLAISVAFGVLFATAVTLILVPTLYFIGNDLGRLFKAGTPPAKTQ